MLKVTASSAIQQGSLLNYLEIQPENSSVYAALYRVKEQIKERQDLDEIERQMLTRMFSNIRGIKQGHFGSYIPAGASTILQSDEGQTNDITYDCGCRIDIWLAALDKAGIPYTYSKEKCVLLVGIRNLIGKDQITQLDDNQKKYGITPEMSNDEVEQEQKTFNEVQALVTNGISNLMLAAKAGKDTCDIPLNREEAKLGLQARLKVLFGKEINLGIHEFRFKSKNNQKLAQGALTNRLSPSIIIKRNGLLGTEVFLRLDLQTQR